MIIVKPTLRVVATILARDESDIIAANIEHHLSQGVTRIIVTDNRSVDGTGDIAARYPEVEVIHEPGDDHRQSEWVTRMARIACKFDPDWVVHLDADELWCGLSCLRTISGRVAGCQSGVLHPPCGLDFDLTSMSKYLDFGNVTGLPGECKVAHRPDPDITITHGNHGVAGCDDAVFTTSVVRHHYPVRSYRQFEGKVVNGHEALKRRNSICERWKRWYDLRSSGGLFDAYQAVCRSWSSMCDGPNRGDLMTLLRFWAEDDVVRMFENTDVLPFLGDWPRRCREK